MQFLLFHNRIKTFSTKDYIAHLPYIEFAMSRLQQQWFFQILLNDMHLALIIDELKQLVCIMRYQYTCT